MGESVISTLNCVGDLSNHFTRAQHILHDVFDLIEGVDGVFDGLIQDGGQFPNQSGFAYRITTLAQQRLGAQALNQWKAMVGLQTDCATSCIAPTTVVDFGNAQHTWVRLMNVAYNTKPYCLTQLFADKLNIQAQIAQIFRDLKFVTKDVLDEFARNNQVGLSRNLWLGYDPSSTNPSLQRSKWRFATDANGDVDTTYIILDSDIDPNFISLLSTDLINKIRNRGIPTGTFKPDGQITFLTDYETFSNLPLFDTNRREDNRFRAPVVLNPEYVATTSYAGYGLKNDYFSLRYYWTTSDPLYPAGVLKRVFHWADEEISEGCFSDTAEAYENADFQLSIPWSMLGVFKRQNGEQPLSAGSGTNFRATDSPWAGTWRWINETNNYTPCNEDYEIGYWRMNLRKAAVPIEFGYRGNVILHRLFPNRGITRSCQTLGVNTAGSPDCTNTCPPLDFFPPALVERFTCGGFNPDGVCAP
jgi:hypothetical protein